MYPLSFTIFPTISPSPFHPTYLSLFHPLGVVSNYYTSRRSTVFPSQNHPLRSLITVILS